MFVVRLESVSKKYLLAHQRPKHTFLDSLLPNFPGQKILEEFFALKDISFEVGSGKVVTVIGRNGSGKTTLLSILAGTCRPTEGQVEIRGKVASLLTIGAGFEENFSGEENIRLNAAILGISKEELREKFREIVAFSELDGFIDVPVKYYSAGMQLRLGFSIAVHVDFDILVIDEILAVGDMSFQKKCYERIVHFRRQGKTIIFSTHDMTMVERIADAAYLLEDGTIASSGDPAIVIAKYLRLVEKKGFSKHQ